MQKNDPGTYQFDLKETVQLSHDQLPIEEIEDMELIPQVEVKDNGEEIDISGSLYLFGNYRGNLSVGKLEAIGEQPSNYEESVQFEPLTVERGPFSPLSKEDKFEHRIPIRINIPKGKVRDVSDVYPFISSFDYELKTPYQIEVIASLVIAGFKEEEEEKEQVEQPLFNSQLEFVHVASENVIQPTNPAEEAIEQRLKAMEEQIAGLEVAQEEQFQVMIEPIDEEYEVHQLEPSEHPYVYLEQEVKPVIEFATEPEVQPVIEFASEPEVGPVTEFVSEPEVGPVIEFVSEPEVGPVIEFASQPEVEQVIQFTSEHEVTPKIENSSEEEVAPEIELSSEQEAEPSPAEEQSSNVVTLPNLGQTAPSNEEMNMEEPEVKVAISKKGNKQDREKITSLSSIFSRPPKEDTIADEKHEEAQDTFSDNNDALYLTNFMGNKEENFVRMKLCIIQKDETIEDIADRYRVQVETILRANQATRNQVTAGQILYIPVKG